MEWSLLRQELVDRLLELCFPSRCVGCSIRGAWLCQHCHTRLERLPRPRCVHCGDIVEGALRREEARAAPLRCRACVHHPPAYARLVCDYVFTGTLRSAIHQLKYRRGRHLAVPLGKLLIELVQAESVTADLVVPVALHRNRELARGFNQSALLARPVAAALALPLATDALERTMDTASQMTLPAARRRENVAGAFQAASEMVRGRRILLIDDVCTTGATLDAAATALRNAGAHTVVAIVLARAIERPSAVADSLLQPL